MQAVCALFVFYGECVDITYMNKVGKGMNMGRIRLYAIVLLLLCAAFITGCKQQPVDERTLSVFELQHSDAMIQAYRNTPLCEDPEQAPEEILQKQDTANPYSQYGLRYYGTFGDYSVWYHFEKAWEDGDMFYETAGYEYIWIEGKSVTTRIRVYQNGDRYHLWKAYYEGIVTLEDLEVIAKRHYEYEQAVKAYEEGQQ